MPVPQGEGAMHPVGIGKTRAAEIKTKNPSHRPPPPPRPRRRRPGPAPPPPARHAPPRTGRALGTPRPLRPQRPLRRGGTLRPQSATEPARPAPGCGHFQSAGAGSRTAVANRPLSRVRHVAAGGRSSGAWDPRETAACRGGRIA